MIEDQEEDGVAKNGYYVIAVDGVKVGECDM